MSDSAGSLVLLVLTILFWLAVVVFSGLLYFLPSIVAFIRKQPNRLSIFGLNLLLGWSLIAWIIALMMAFGNENRQGIQNTFYLSSFMPGKANPSPPMAAPMVTAAEVQSPAPVDSTDRETSNIVLISVAACALLALVLFGGSLFYYISRSTTSRTIQQGSNAVREAPSPTVHTPQDITPPAPVVQPQPKVILSLGTVTIFRQDSLILNNPQKCHVRLRPNITSFVSGNSMSLGYIPCGGDGRIKTYHF